MCLGEESVMEMESWTCEQVSQWVATIGCHEEVCDIFSGQRIDGFALKYLTMEDIDRICPSLVMGDRKRILVKRDNYVKEKDIPATSASVDATTPDSYPSPNEDTGHEQLRPFDSHPDISFKYKAWASIPVCPSRIDNLTTPIHKFVDIDKVTRRSDAIPNICRQTVQFACACLNDHTNGTIHFGIKDQRINGVELTVGPQAVNHQLTLALRGAFDFDQHDIVLGCVRPAKFIKVLKPGTKDIRYVIEVDVRPVSELCGKETFYAKAPELQFKNQSLVFEDPFIFR